MKATLRLAWDRFNLVASVIGDVQGRVIAVGFYFTILVPFGLISRFTGDPLRLHLARSSACHWLDREPVPDDLDSARQQG